MDERTEDGHQTAPKRTPAEEAYDLLARQMAEMTEAEAAALLRSPPKRTNQRTKPGKKVPIKALIEQARTNTTGLRTPLHGMNMVLALSSTLMPPGTPLAAYSNKLDCQLGSSVGP